MPNKRGSNETKVNNKVWLLAGRRTRCFLYIVDGLFTLISEAYINRIINGEGVYNIKEILGPI